MTLIPVAEAQARLIALKRPLPTQSTALDHCVGRWLAEPVAALRDQPWADLSAMDGYAIRFADLPGPWTLAGVSAAGGLKPPSIGRGETVRIFTGAPLPDGADCILVQEEADDRDGAIHLAGAGPGRAGKHVRPAGGDFTAATLLLRAGARLTPPALALAALAGHGALPVRRKVRIAILSSGDELVAPGAPVPPGKLPSSNGVLLRAMLAGLPVDILDLGIVADDLAATQAAMESARTQSADILLTTGGASVGDHDLIRPAFAAIGGTLDFWRIRMRPGKPLMAGTLGDMLLLGLPGNPVSAFVTATLFLLPLVRHLSGDPAPLPQSIGAVLGGDLPATQVRAEYIRASLDGPVATPLGDQDSAASRALAGANALILREGSAPPLAAGSPVIVIPL